MDQEKKEGGPIGLLTHVQAMLSSERLSFQLILANPLPATPHATSPAVALVDHRGCAFEWIRRLGPQDARIFSQKRYFFPARQEARRCELPVISLRTNAKRRWKPSCTKKVPNLMLALVKADWQPFFRSSWPPLSSISWQSGLRTNPTAFS